MKNTTFPRHLFHQVCTGVSDTPQVHCQVGRVGVRYSGVGDVHAVGREVECQQDTTVRNGAGKG